MSITVDKKRKRYAEGVVEKTVSRKAAKLDNEVKDEILSLEESLDNARNSHDSLLRLLEIQHDSDTSSKDAVLAAVSLCRGFSKMIVRGQLRKAKAEVSAKKLFQQYVQMLHTWIRGSDAGKESAAVTLLMRLVKEEAQQEGERGEQSWRNAVFPGLVKQLVSSPDAGHARQLFVEKYVEEYDDVRYYTFMVIQQTAKEEGIDADGVLDLFRQIEGVPSSDDQLEDWYGRAPAATKHSLLSLSAHLKAAQEACLAVFRSSLTHSQRKSILGMMPERMTLWFAGKLEVLTDFLTDSFNTAGSTAVLALDGIFNLITERNLDYPDFYLKLYSLLDDDILHSKYRSNFLRLLTKCLASTHLPSSLVASFMKRLARLSLQAPPGAIVWVVPWIYNTLRQHPSMTFMLHRVEHPAHAIYAQYPDPETTGMHDIFDMSETDPMLTRAIESSLWEVQTLASHYHPNVATLASILGEQFTKREYQLEDFLDHSYATLLDRELSRELKKEPVVEWEIPKHIVTATDGSGELNSLGALLQQAVDVI